MKGLEWKINKLKKIYESILEKKSQRKDRKITIKNRIGDNGYGGKREKEKK